jgi:histidyl-tRNA synthetase
MGKKTEPIPGTSDIFPAEIAEWLLLETEARRVFGLYGYGELRTPVMERTAVFERSIGEQTDVVQKEMYTFEDRGGRSLTLRPEGTAGVIRALVDNGIPQGDEKRVYYIGPMFRGERPAAGRKRQFHQIGAECVGTVAPETDIETIEMLMRYFDAIGIRNTRLLVNSRGTAADRPKIADTLTAYFRDRLDDMCEDCQRRLESNVWRILDCKNEDCCNIVAGAPAITDLLSAESRDFFQRACDRLDLLGLPYNVDPRLVRGLDYYEHTVYEIAFDGIGAQNSLAGGGRYAIEVPGHKQMVYGTGFAIGMERLILARHELGVATATESGIDAYLVSIGEEAFAANMKLARDLRSQGFSIAMDLQGRGTKAQMRTANKLEAAAALIRGDNELARDMVVCKNLSASKQLEVAIDDLPAHLQSILDARFNALPHAEE